jgi:hypothetical protein
VKIKSRPGKWLLTCANGGVELARLELATPCLQTGPAPPAAHARW